MAVLRDHTFIRSVSITLLTTIRVLAPPFALIAEMRRVIGVQSVCVFVLIVISADITYGLYKFPIIYPASLLRTAPYFRGNNIFN